MRSHPLSIALLTCSLAPSLVGAAEWAAPGADAGTADELDRVVVIATLAETAIADVPVSDAFLIGSFSDANLNSVDLDTLKRVEVLRGPGRALYFSNALGVVVSFRTKDPEDYLDSDAQRTAWRLAPRRSRHSALQ
jgi:hypothetical protein